MFRMRLTLRQLQIFTAVADTGSTTAAGARVALSQSATSGALNELESMLGVQLFDRVGKRLAINDTGRALLPQARVMLDGAHAIEDQFFTDADGVGVLSAALRVGASTTIGNYVLPGLIAGYWRAAPHAGDGGGGLAAPVDVTIGNTREIVEAVARLDVDMGLIEGPSHLPDVCVRPWRSDRMVVVVAASHPLVANNPDRPVGLPALRQQRWLLREPGSGTRVAMDSAVLSHLHQWHQPMQLGSTEAIKQAAVEGLGLACLSLCAVQDQVALQRLVILPTVLPPLLRQFYLVHQPKKHFSAALARFIAHCEREDVA